MAQCMGCGRSDERVAAVLSLCADCIRQGGGNLAERIALVHAQERGEFGLPGRPPRDEDGLSCGICVNQCRMGEGRRGYCGIRKNVDGRLEGGDAEAAHVTWYHDPLPTNCVADWVCAGGTGAGYPAWSYAEGPERGYRNLAVFYEACSFDCLFCQNWHYRRGVGEGRTHSADELARAATPRTACICFFGGDPTPQLPHALKAAELALEGNPDRVLRICWETNGSMAPGLLDRMMSLSLDSGGCLKFDLKAFNPRLHRALCGTENARTLENFRTAAGRVGERPDPPPLVASTLLVPGYVDEEEVSRIAEFIAALDPTVPYALLAFHGEFLMTDLPTTSRSQAERCLTAARDAGLSRVRLGNTHLLGVS